MANVRFIKTRTWQDGWFSKLSADAKLLFLFLLTNSNTHICGYYEMPTHQICGFLGWTEKKLDVVFTELAGKIEYFDGWVCIKNYPKHQNVVNNAKVQESIERAMEQVPREVVEKSNAAFNSSIIHNNNTNSEAIDSLSIVSKSGKPVDKDEETMKKRYGEGKHVLLTDVEKSKIIETYGREAAKQLVDELDSYIGSKGARYKNHYFTLRSWARRKGLQVIPSSEPKMIGEQQPDGSVRLVPNPKYKDHDNRL